MLGTALSYLSVAAIIQEDIANALHHSDESLRLCLENGDLGDLHRNLVGVALCLTVSGDWELAITLHGAADGRIEQMHQSFFPLEEKLREGDHSRLRQAMGDKAFEAAYAVGRHLSSSEAIGLAEQAIQRLIGAQSRNVTIQVLISPLEAAQDGREAQGEDDGAVPVPVGRDIDGVGGGHVHEGQDGGDRSPGSEIDVRRHLLEQRRGARRVRDERGHREFARGELAEVRSRVDRVQVHAHVVADGDAEAVEPGDDGARGRGG